MLTAATISAPLGYCAAMPPATARPPRDAANSRARRVITWASIPTAAATRSGALASSAARTRATSAGTGASRRETITCAIASASIPSLPGAQRLERERLVGHVPAADLPGPGVDQLAERPAFEPCDEGDALAAGVLHLGLQASQRIVPAELLPGAVRTARHRIGDPIGVVQALECRLPARAQAALVDGRLGVALELDHPALAHLGGHPAPRRALPTGGRVVGGDARDLILRRHEVGDELLGGLGADAAPRHSSGAAAGRAHDFQEPSAIHCVGPQ